MFASLIDSTITSNWFPLYRKLKRETDASDASNPIYEYNLHQSQNIVELLNNVLRGMEASIFKLNLIVEECIFLELEFSQGQRIVMLS